VRIDHKIKNGELRGGRRGLIVQVVYYKAWYTEKEENRGKPAGKQYSISSTVSARKTGDLRAERKDTRRLIK